MKIFQTYKEEYSIPESGLPIELEDAITINTELRKFASEYPEKKIKKYK